MSVGTNATRDIMPITAPTIINPHFTWFVHAPHTSAIPIARGTTPGTIHPELKTSYEIIEGKEGANIISCLTLTSNPTRSRDLFRWLVHAPHINVIVITRESAGNTRNIGDLGKIPGK